MDKQNLDKVVADNNSAAVRIDELSYRYPDGTNALNGVSLTIPKGVRTAILGANGCGKSTLFFHINGLLSPHTGKVYVFDDEVKKANLKKIRQQVGFVFANPDSQVFATSVREDIAFGPRNLSLTEEEVHLRVEWAMEQVGIMDLANRPPQNLSLGQKKRVAIAGVLAMKPDILVFDEPTVGLDPAAKRQLFSILNKLEDGNRTIIISTHDVDLAYSWAEQIIVMSNGQVVKIGPPEILCDAELIERAALEIPQLAQAFCGSGYQPRTAAEANRVISKLINS
ncbi:energy-coupling factor ABC transporter ATP-binding protein [Desulfuribacillus alkaliarsenatis]|uniref:ABC transporter ATP-binding protein n=1 Tax=Desulfuribacillus alkaliarsenatis TaxID=766136 RepID=A0A1E5G3U0_9FIRM|nr:ATP-binding cassette domain-containing protein [Desulfuribacillus alkaliarsenatis]OEF97745.1 energy-coupling factor ABC transporter ATP-binding protein [Desulfuribacillus alkaliarsenatis]